MYAGGFEQFEITGVKNKSLYECQMTPLISKTIDQFEINNKQIQKTIISGLSLKT